MRNGSATTGPTPGDDVEVDADGRQRDDDVGEEDRGVDAVAAHRLQGDLGDEVRARGRTRASRRPRARSRYSGSERPAWRMNHTGVWSTGWRRAARTRCGVAGGGHRDDPRWAQRSDDRGPGRDRSDADLLDQAQPLAQDHAGEEDRHDGVERAEHAGDADLSARRGDREEGVGQQVAAADEQQRGQSRAGARPRPSGGRARAVTKMTTDVSRIPQRVMSVEVRAPRSMQNRAVPNATAATPASTTGRTDTPPLSSGPHASVTPTTATSMPTQAHDDGASPLATPSRTGTTTPSAAMGATTPMVPVDSAE